MMRPIPFAVGEYYHVYNRGVEKRSIFITKKDWQRFQKLLYFANSSVPYKWSNDDQPLANLDQDNPLVAIGAYVLMPNHFHLLIKEIQDGGITLFMQKLCTGYSMYFNKRHERVGPLFQGRFKAEHVDNDRYLKYLYAYIHLNPLKLIEPNWKEIGVKNKFNASNHVEKYNFSSYLDHCNIKREENKIITKEEFPRYFSTKVDFKTDLFDWLELKKDSDPS